MFRHYASEVREKGALTTISTDRTEIWHKVLKAADTKRNRNNNCSKFIVRYISCITAFRVKMSNLDLESPIIPQATSEQVIDDANRVGLISDASAAASGGDRGVELYMEDNDDEELKLEAVPSEGNPTTQTPKGMTWRWPKRVRKGWPRLASSTEDVVGLSGFRVAVASCNRMHPATIELTSPIFDDDDPMIYVFNTVQIAYPAMSLTYLINMDETSQTNPHASGLVVDDVKCVNQYIQSGPSSEGWRDFVLVKQPISNKKHRTQKTSMTYRRVVEVLLLFKYNREAMNMISAHRGSDVGEYVYVQ